MVSSSPSLVLAPSTPFFVFLPHTTESWDYFGAKLADRCRIRGINHLRVGCFMKTINLSAVTVTRPRHIMLSVGILLQWLYTIPYISDRSVSTPIQHQWTKASLKAPSLVRYFSLPLVYCRCPFSCVVLTFTHLFPFLILLLSLSLFLHHSVFHSHCLLFTISLRHFSVIRFIGLTNSSTFILPKVTGCVRKKQKKIFITNPCSNIPVHIPALVSLCCY